MEVYILMAEIEFGKKVINSIKHGSVTGKMESYKIIGIFLDRKKACESLDEFSDEIENMSNKEIAELFFIDGDDNFTEYMTEVLDKYGFTIRRMVIKHNVNV